GPVIPTPAGRAGSPREAGLPASAAPRTTSNVGPRAGERATAPYWRQGSPGRSRTPHWPAPESVASPRLLLPRPTGCDQETIMICDQVDGSRLAAPCVPCRRALAPEPGALEAA